MRTRGRQVMLQRTTSQRGIVLKLRRPSLGTILGAIALTVSLGGVAIAAIPGSDGTIQGCYNPSGAKPPFALNVVDNPADCASPSVLLPFAQRGPTGATGPAGASGEPSGVYQASNIGPPVDQTTMQAGGQITVRLPLPAGAYAVTGRVAVQPADEAEGNCQLVARDSSGFHDADNVSLWSGVAYTPVQDTSRGALPGATIRGDHFSVFVNQQQTHASLQLATTLVSSGGIELSCHSDRYVFNVQMKIMAIKVGSVATFRPNAAVNSELRVPPTVPAKPHYPTTIHLPPPPPVHHQPPPTRK
jgi:hypothetical protein